MPDNLLMTCHATRPPRMHRRQLARSALALACTVLLGEVHAKDTHLPRPASLSEAARRANAKGEPLVLLVSLPGCPYCELVRRNYLKPMRDHEGLHAWQIDIRDKMPLTAFDLRTTTPLSISRDWGVRVTPTVMFLDAQGREIAPRIEGVAVADFFGTYLEDRLKQSRETLARSVDKTPP